LRRTWFVAALIAAVLMPLPSAAADVTHFSSLANTVTHVIARGESLAMILGRYGVGAHEVDRWWRAARPARDLSRLSVGHELNLTFSQERNLIALGYAIDDGEKLIVERDDDAGALRAHVESRQVVVEPVGVRGTVKTTFFASALQAGVPESMISQMVDLLAAKINFSSEVHAGDRFRVLYERRSDLRGRVLKPGRILAAEFRGSKDSADAYLYQDEAGESAYVDAAGSTLDDALLRYPLEFTRISSTFSYSRFHPILKRRRPHLGVDFAAPTGTPVRSVGTGKVRWAAWKGGLGRHVEVDHGGGLVSAYSHLKGIQQVVRPGARVERGQVIGWVGKSGRATGPHLHFAIFDNERYVNPLERRRASTVTHIDPKRFAAQRDQLAQQLRAATGHRPALSTAPVAFSPLSQTRHLEPLALTL
jgi:murein DD-endopeptidase MepM/ murein hydrolase activator NlpD